MNSTIELKATQSKVHAVTVFQADRAEVVRLFTVDLKAGQNEKEGELWSADKEGKKRATRVTVVVYAEHDGTAEIRLTYMVFNASWRPLYDLRATVGATKTSIVLHYRAIIAQSTGEDWKEVALTLSTASPQLGSTIPSLKPLWVNPVYQRFYTAKAKGGFGGGGMREMRKEQSIESDEEERDRPRERYSDLVLGGAALALPDATPLESTMSTSFVIEGFSNIPSDTDATSQAHKVTVAVIDLTADLQWITVPKEQTSAFLQAQVKNSSAYLLLPGKTNVFLDDNFVSKSFIDQVSPNEIFHISLGVDSQVKVTYHPRTKKTRTQGGILTGRSVITSLYQKVSVKNTRSAPIKKLVIRDQVPVSGDQRIKVSLVEPASLEFGGRNTISASGTSKIKGKDKSVNIPKEIQISKGIIVRWKVNEDKENDDAATVVSDNASEIGLAGLDGAREGMIEWVCEIPAGQSVDVMLAWEVIAPVGLNWGPQ
ncbi:hypothetical protein FRC17_006502 [Serendipita sp. 399]|nr:hypothetical protein FRC17_006502 [Serendipita sp. 399]